MSAMFLGGCASTSSVSQVTQAAHIANIAQDVQAKQLAEASGNADVVHAAHAVQVGEVGELTVVVQEIAQQEVKKKPRTRVAKKKVSPEAINDVAQVAEVVEVAQESAKLAFEAMGVELLAMAEAEATQANANELIVGASENENEILNAIVTEIIVSEAQATNEIAIDTAKTDNSANTANTADNADAHKIGFDLYDNDPSSASRMIAIEEQVAMVMAMPMNAVTSQPKTNPGISIKTVKKRV